MRSVSKMAALRRCILSNIAKIPQQSRSLSTKSKSVKQISSGVIGGSVLGVTLGTFWLNKARKPSTSPAFATKKDGVEAEQRDEAKRAAIQTARELRFLSFASVEYDGNIYMTPQDFLESVTDEAPRARTGRRRLHPDDVNVYLKKTPPRWKGTAHLLRSLDDKGLISYTEYLFLLCVLTKPHSGFRIAFNMFDTDGNQRVDKQEFLVMESVMSGGNENEGLQWSILGRGAVDTTSQLVECVQQTFGRQTVRKTEHIDYPPQIHGRRNIWNVIHNFTSLEQIIPHSEGRGGHQRGGGGSGGGSSGGGGSGGSSHKDGGERKGPTDTTLAVHFFGRKGNDVLKYEDFHRFMDNLQTEVLELEFHEFSHGMASITEEEFAKVLLRYTILTEDETQDYLDRLKARVPHVKGISFEDFKDFGQFLNNLDDFAIAMRLYTFNGKPINEEEFKRAVKAVTGHSLNPHLVHVVFQLFDSDGDGHLSHKEFISVMKDRLHRGFRSQSLQNQGRWDLYKACIKNDMKH